MSIEKPEIIVEAISYADVNGKNSALITKYPTIKFVRRNGNLVAVNRITMSPEEKEENSIFYDVSNASDEFKAVFSDIIQTINVVEKEPLSKKKREEKPKGSVIRNLISEYEPIIEFMLPEERKELEAAGLYAVISNENGGFEIEPSISKAHKHKGLTLYYDVTDASSEFLEKYGDKGVFEVYSDEDGYYHTLNESKIKRN